MQYHTETHSNIQKSLLPSDFNCILILTLLWAICNWPTAGGVETQRRVISVLENTLLWFCDKVVHRYFDSGALGGDTTGLLTIWVVNPTFSNFSKWKDAASGSGIEQAAGYNPLNLRWALMAHPTNFHIPLQAFRTANAALLLVSSLELALSVLWKQIKRFKSNLSWPAFG